MVDTTSQVTTLHALLIGIDCYLPNRLPSGGHYRNLEGCVRDVSLVEQYLREDAGVPASRILKLTATNSPSGEPAEPRAQWPTYRNIVEAFRRLTEVAQPGEQVYIHYSGHGGRAVTTYPELKGARGLDEALVPVDIGDAATQYVRDVELAHLIQQMVEKRLLVTLVLDSCHSGSTTRLSSSSAPPRAGAVARGIETIDTTPRPSPSAVAPAAELVATWRFLGARQKRGLKPESGWLAEPSGYVLLAACRASESAYEFSFDGEPSGGVLTHWLLDSLRQSAASLTYKQLYDRVLAKIQTEFSEQTPQLEGEDDRVIFGSARVRAQYAVGVLQVDLPNQRVLLHAGEAQGLRPGALFAIYDWAATDYMTPDARLALVELTEVDATQSWATLVERLRPTPLEQGQQAVLLQHGATPWQSSVSLSEQSLAQPDGTRARALSEVGRTLVQQGRGYLRTATEGEAADYQVVLDTRGEYNILDGGGAALTNLRPTLKSDQPDAPARLTERLIHLTKYESTRRLSNSDPASPLAGKLFVEVVGGQTAPAVVTMAESQPDAASRVPTFTVGDRLVVRIRNDYSEVLNITVLDLSPDWAVTQIHPARAGLFEPLDPGQEVSLALTAGLPPGCADGSDLIKVFASVGTPNFRWLELPALDEPPTQRGAAATRGDLIDELEKSLRTNTSPLSRRNLQPEPQTTQAWWTRQLEVRIKAA